VFSEMTLEMFWKEQSIMTRANKKLKLMIKVESKVLEQVTIRFAVGARCPSTAADNPNLWKVLVAD